MELFQHQFGAFFLIFGVIGFGIFILEIWALIDILRSNFADSNNKLTWGLIVLLIPFIGPILYFAIGRKQRIS